VKIRILFINAKELYSQISRRQNVMSEEISTGIQRGAFTGFEGRERADGKN